VLAFSQYSFRLCFVCLFSNLFSNGYAQDVSESNVSQPVNNGGEYYASLTAATDNNAHIYSQISRRDANAATVTPSREQYATVTEW